MNTNISKTQQNLLRAFAGESMARNKYTQFAKIARKDDLEWVARVFEETAENERVHAAELFELINDATQADTKLEITPFKTTIENLTAAAEGEKYEWTSMYPDFEKTAIEEKEPEAARLFGRLKEVEEKHEERYVILTSKLSSNSLYSADTELEWKCLNCGYIYKGKMPPQKCPLCLKPQTWYMQLGLLR